jgi:phospholipid/cholesterol/gamma-HCH transport system substrate-binding protein
MRTRGPTFGQVAVAVAFAFSCFGLLLFLWSTFGGPIPLKPEGYRFKVPFDEATQLAVESDVRIANVSVGKVKKIELGEGENSDFAVATVEVDDRYAPIPQNTRAMLRQKTLLGETYVELSQGDDAGPQLEEGESLPAAQVAPSVQLDEIFRTFDERTRVAFQTWMQQAAVAFAGRGADVSAAIANLEPFAEDANRLLRVLDTQEGAVKQFVNNTGVVFEALSERQGQLRGLVQNAGAVFSTTARRNQDLRETFIALPTFLDESRLTLTRLETFAEDTDPLIDQLHPAARELSKVLRQTARVAPDFEGFFVGFRKLATRGEDAFPALRALLSTDLPPLLTQVTPFLRQVTPIIDTLQRYRADVTGFLGNVTAATQAFNTGTETGDQFTHYLRTAATLSPEAFAVFPNRLTTNRSNPYVEPGGALDVASALQSFAIDACPGATREIANLVPATAADPVFINRFLPGDPVGALDLFDRLQQFGFNDTLSSATTAAPPCVNQGPQPSIGSPSESTNYLHVYPTP